ncbi:MAG: hypothetical protein QM679_10180, partial [Patulibacter sp.]
MSAEAPKVGVIRGMTGGASRASAAAHGPRVVQAVNFRRPAPHRRPPRGGAPHVRAAPARQRFLRASARAGVESGVMDPGKLTERGVGLPHLGSPRSAPIAPQRSQRRTSLVLGGPGTGKTARIIAAAEEARATGRAALIVAVSATAAA